MFLLYTILHSPLSLPLPLSPSRQGHKEVFELIHSKALYSALLENLIPLLEVDTQVGKVWHYVSLHLVKDRQAFPHALNNKCTARVYCV